VNWTRTIFFGLIAASAATAMADTTSSNTTVPELSLEKAAKAQGDVLSFLVPKVGIRIGGGSWEQFMLDGGVDVTFKVPFIPLPAIRVDGEVWGETSNFGQDKRGNAVSILGVETIALFYYGVGPTYYFTDNQGDRQSGFGAKLLGGLSMPGGFFVEASLLLGPSSVPVFFSIGERF